MEIFKALLYPTSKQTPPASYSEQSSERFGDEREGIKSVLEGGQNHQFLPKIKLDF